MTIRILQVVTSMNAGGIETMLMNYYRNIDRSKVQFDFLVHRKEKGIYDDQIKKLGGKIYYFGRFSNIFIYNKRVKNFLLESNYKIIHSHINQYSFFPLKIAKNNQIPVRISHSHQYLTSNTSIKFMKKLLIYFCRYRLQNQFTHAFACSSQAGEWLFNRNKLFKVINNSIETKEYIYNREKAEKVIREFDLQDRLVISHIGNFSTTKNYPFILNVFMEVLKKKKDAVLMLIGANQNNPEIEKMVEKMGMENSVIFTGVRSDIPELLQISNVFLFPSISEGLPVSLIEAQAAGVPCIISDTITREVKITDLVEFESLKSSPQVWGDKILMYANKNEKPNTSQSIVLAGYDINDNAKQLIDFYIHVNESN